MEQNLLYVEQEIIFALGGNLKRLFLMGITPTTFLDLKNLIVISCKNNTELAKQLFEMLMMGDISQIDLQDKVQQELAYIIRENSIGARLSKEMFERGDFIDFMSSDVIEKQSQQRIVSRVKKIDGKELVFVSDIGGVVNIISHFTDRLNEIAASSTGASEIREYKQNLAALQNKVDSLLDALN